MRLLSLFSGCGGMDLGFHGDFKVLSKSINSTIHPNFIKENNGEFVTLQRTKFDIVFANDIFESAKTAWCNYFKDKVQNAKDIYHLESIVNLVKDAKNNKNIFPDNIDIVIGGFPCQDFSVSGKRLGFNSTKSHLGELIDKPNIENRGQLYIWMKEVIEITKPKLFIAENVKGLTNLNDTKEIIEHDFASTCNAGYLVVPAKILNAKNYGVPQSRERVIFFGFRKDALNEDAYIALSKPQIEEKYDPYPVITHKNIFVTCSDAFIGLKEPSISDDLSQQKYSKASYLGDHLQGQKEIQLDNVAPTIRSEHHGNIEYRRLSQEHNGKHLSELKNGLIERRLTIRECARLQTFPDDYSFVLNKSKNSNGISMSDAYKIIGNAVPPLLAYNIAKNIEDKWELYFKEN